MKKKGLVAVIGGVCGLLASGVAIFLGLRSRKNSVDGEGEIETSYDEETSSEEETEE